MMPEFVEDEKNDYSICVNDIPTNFYNLYFVNLFFVLISIFLRLMLIFQGNVLTFSLFLEYP